jgi:hypothetical protein
LPCIFLPECNFQTIDVAPAFWDSWQGPLASFAVESEELGFSWAEFAVLRDLALLTDNRQNRQRYTAVFRQSLLIRSIRYSLLCPSASRKLNPVGELCTNYGILSFGASESIGNEERAKGDKKDCIFMQWLPIPPRHFSHFSQRYDANDAKEHFFELLESLGSLARRGKAIARLNYGFTKHHV